MHDALVLCRSPFFARASRGPRALWASLLLSGLTLSPTAWAAAPEGVAEATRQQAQADFQAGRELASSSSKRYQDAIPLLERALSADPSLGEAHLYLGICYAHAREMAKGAHHYEQFLKAMPRHPQAASVKAILREYYAKTGNAPEAAVDEPAGPEPVDSTHQ